MEDKFALRLELARRERGFLQKDMAKHLGVKPATWSRFERGHNRPHLDDFIKIVEKLNVSADWLLGFTDEEPRLPRTKRGKK